MSNIQGEAMSEKVVRVVEVFAGVGGFRCGLEQASPNFKTIWANQWEPGKKVQHAYACYIANFGENESHVNEDISIAKERIPQHDLLVGGFPCQDYSVAATGAKGMEGKKGVLWWQINDILVNRRPPFVLLENVDRLLKSPASQRGRDFGVMLRCFDDLGYAVEWRVLNAADYGFAQRRRRVFIFAFHKSTNLHQKLIANYSEQSASDWLHYNGLFAQACKVEGVESVNNKKNSEFTLGKSDYETLIDVSSNFHSQFFNSGILLNGKILTRELIPIKLGVNDYETLGDIVEKTGQVEEKYYIGEKKKKFEGLKDAKKIPRIKPNGEPYFYSEGAMNFPDPLDKPGRTLLTSESSVNRSTHVIEDPRTGHLRVLTPEECEALNGFTRGWTDKGMPEKFRYFTMGNALVVPLVKKIGEQLLKEI
jgi:DNA (cytosine-5)-methyltransferase 1